VFTSERNLSDKNGTRVLHSGVLIPWLSDSSAGAKNGSNGGTSAETVKKKYLKK